MNQGQYENLFEQAQITNMLLREIAGYLKPVEHVEELPESATVEIEPDASNVLVEVKPTKGRKPKAYN